MPQVPEMYFGFNHITIENTKTNVKWSYNTNDAFRKVQINLKENENWIKVAVADKWNASRKLFFFFFLIEIQISILIIS